MVLSSQCLPISINPIGRPSDWPHGTLMAGCPVASNGAVLLIISNARWMETSRGASAGGSGVALSGSVGITSTSKSASAAS